MANTKKSSGKNLPKGTLKNANEPVTVEGTDQNDRFFATEAVENFIGGGGSRDRVDYRSSDRGIKASLSQAGPNNSGDTFIGIEGLLGSRYADKLTGDAGNNILSGRLGNDMLFGGDGNDRLNGGRGNDKLFGGTGNDILNGGSGADMLNGGEGMDWARYNGSDAAVVIDLDLKIATGGHANGDVLISIENLTGSKFDDQLSGTDDANRINGHNGNDIIFGRGGNDRLNGGAGEDMIRGGEGADRIFGGKDDDTLFGDAGNDVLRGGHGADYLDGGEGIDRAVYTKSTEGVAVDLEAGTGSGGEAEGDRLVAIENLTGSRYDDFLKGNDVANRLTGLDGNDVIDGAGGDDWVSGGKGNDVISGGGGSDRVNGGSGNDTVRGGEGADRVTGGAGFDKLFGGDGDDKLFGGDDNDILNGGAGADRLHGGNGDRDAADYVDALVGITANLTTARGSGGEAEGDTYHDIEYLYGSEFDDLLIGNADVNRLVGRDGDDVLNGMEGNDILRGGLGADHLIGGEGDRDAADYSWSREGVEVSLLANFGVGGEAEGDTFETIEFLYGSDYDDHLTGDDGINRLVGSEGNDVLSGQGGNDYLLGEEGNDTLTGGAGRDVFLYETNFGADKITDFEAGAGLTDRLWLRDHTFSSYDDLSASLVDTVEGVLLDLGENGSILFSGLVTTAFADDDFIL